MSFYSLRAECVHTGRQSIGVALPDVGPLPPPKFLLSPSAKNPTDTILAANILHYAESLDAPPPCTQKMFFPPKNSLAPKTVTVYVPNYKISLLSQKVTL